MTEPEYNAYFEDLAAKSVAIAHSAEHPAFYVVRDNNLAELENAIRSRLNLPAFLLDQYFDDVDTENDNYRLTVHGGLSVVCRVEVGNSLSIRTARHQARTIALQFLKRLRMETRTPGSDLYGRRIQLSTHHTGEMSDIIAGGIATGWGYSFTMTMPHAVAVEASDWQDTAE